MQELLLAPSILAADHADLATGLELVQSLGIRWLHLDIMDGHFVPNLSFGPATVAALRKRAPELFFDTHLMMDNPHRYVKAFSDAGADLISIHLEPEYPIKETLEEIRGLGKGNGIVLNPATPPEAALPYLDSVDMILVMTVWPGFGGQSFIEDCLPKLECLRDWRDNRKLMFRLEVDGGITEATAHRCRDAGADTFVAGTAFFTADDPAAFRTSIES
jgi:ribulose-phosphate 3-epimerase